MVARGNRTSNKPIKLRLSMRTLCTSSLYYVDLLANKPLKFSWMPYLHIFHVHRVDMRYFLFFTRTEYMNLLRFINQVPAVREKSRFHDETSLLKEGQLHLHFVRHSLRGYQIPTGRFAPTQVCCCLTRPLRGCGLRPGFAIWYFVGKGRKRLKCCISAWFLFVHEMWRNCSRSNLLRLALIVA